MAPQDYTFVFVPGGWHSPERYGAVIAHLHEAGYNTAKVWLPSVVRPGQPVVTSIEPDIVETRKHITAAVDKGQKVVLVCHSYSGHVASFAAEGFYPTSFEDRGHTDGRGIVHIVYICAFMLRVGESPLTAGASLDWIKGNDELEGTMVPSDPGHVFYNDFESKAEVNEWVADLNPHSHAPGGAPLTHEPFKHIPVTYLACIKDNALPFDWQQRACQRAKDAGAIDLRVVEWDCGHTPFGSRPLETSQLIKSTVEGTT